MIIAGGSAIPRQIDFGKMREIADSVGAYLLVDMAPCDGDHYKKSCMRTNGGVTRIGRTTQKAPSLLLPVRLKAHPSNPASENKRLEILS